jgi:glutamate dehydrogenase/leucine dehydrogenase
MGPFEMMDSVGGTGYEQVVHCWDAKSGLRAIIAVHSTALGPALGGTRFRPYASEEAALLDVLRLARGMSYKAAAAGLDLGGGKAVIIGDPRTDKTEPLLRAYGRFVESLGGRYITAEDMGTTMADMETIARETRFVTGRATIYGGGGDPSVLTAYGVRQGMLAVAEHLWGSADLHGRHVAIQGVGKVGHALCGHLVKAGAEVTIADADVDNLARAVSDFGVDTVAPEDVHKMEVDIFAPCALGGIINDDTISEFQCKIIAGAANNQLAADQHGEKLRDLGILYAPDFVINAGGVLHVVGLEMEGWPRERLDDELAGIGRTLSQIFARADAEGISTLAAAERLARERESGIAEPHAVV